MKKILIGVLLLMVATAAAADHGYRGGYYGYSNNWVAPLVGGVILGAMLAPRPVYAQPYPVYTPPPVYVEQPQVIYVQPRTKQVTVYVPECNCYRVVEIPAY